MGYACLWLKSNLAGNAPLWKTRAQPPGKEAGEREAGRAEKNEPRATSHEPKAKPSLFLNRKTPEKLYRPRPALGLSSYLGKFLKAQSLIYGEMPQLRHPPAFLLPLKKWELQSFRAIVFPRSCQVCIIGHHRFVAGSVSIIGNNIDCEGLVGSFGNFAPNKLRNSQKPAFFATTFFSLNRGRLFIHRHYVRMRLLSCWAIFQL